LKLWYGHRRLPRNLTSKDVEELALALTAYHKGYAKVETGTPLGRSYVVIIAEGWSLAVGSEVWRKLFPSIKEGTFLNQIVPLEQTYSSSVYRGVVAAKEQDPLYRRILLTLKTVLI